MLTRREAGIALGVSAVVVGMLWLAADLRGAVGIPRADDWSYLLTQQAFDQGLGFVMNNWAVTMLVGQTVLLSPIGQLTNTSIAVLQACIALFAAGSLWATYLLLRQATGRWVSAACTTMLGVTPIFAPSAISFMTDVPAFLFEVLCLLAGLRAVRRGPLWPWLTASIALGLIGFTFRDYAVIAIIVVVAVAVAHTVDGRTRVLICVAGFAGLTIAALLYSWRHSLPNDLKLDGWTFEVSVRLAAQALLTLALLCVPMLFVLSPQQCWRSLRAMPWWWQLATAAVPVAIVGLARGQLLGNVVHPFADTWLVAGAGIRIMPLWPWRFVVLIACLALVGVCVLASVGLHRAVMAWRAGVRPTSVIRRSPEIALLTFFPITLVAAHLGATVLLGTWLIDRYFIPAIPFLCAAIFLAARAWGLIAARPSVLQVRVWSALAVYAFFGLGDSDFKALSEGTRWAAGEQVVAKTGLDPAVIDAGVQWFSYHQPTIGLGAQVVPTGPGRTWWTARYPGQQVCATVLFVEPDAPTPGSGPELVRVRAQGLLGTAFDAVAVPGPDVCDFRK